jgi:hypothetical protein
MSSKYYVSSGDSKYWAVKTSNGGVDWIPSTQISDDRPPDKFTQEESDYINKSLPANVHAKKTTELPKQSPFSGVETPKQEVKKPSGAKKPQGNDKQSDWLYHLPSAFQWLLVFLLLAGIGAAMVVNAQPFVRMVQMMTGDDAGGTASMPIIGWVITFLSISAAVLVGALWYAIFQCIEIAPAIMTASDRRTLLMINSILNCASLKINPGENADVRWLKTQYNQRPIAGIQFFRRCRWPIRLTELAVCLITHPPIAGGIGAFLNALRMMQFSKINWGNIALTFSVIFVVDWLVKIVLHLLRKIHAEKQLVLAEKEG